VRLDGKHLTKPDDFVAPRIHDEGAPELPSGKIDVGAFVAFWIENEVRAVRAALSMRILRTIILGRRPRTKLIKLICARWSCSKASSTLRLRAPSRVRRSRWCVRGCSRSRSMACPLISNGYTEGLAVERAETIGAPELALRH
jgi:hypothetical protein